MSYNYDPITNTYYEDRQSPNPGPVGGCMMLGVLLFVFIVVIVLFFLIFSPFLFLTDFLLELETNYEFSGISFMSFLEPEFYKENEADFLVISGSIYFFLLLFFYAVYQLLRGFTIHAKERGSSWWMPMGLLLTIFIALPPIHFFEVFTIELHPEFDLYSFLAPLLGAIGILVHKPTFPSKSFQFMTWAFDLGKKAGNRIFPEKKEDLGDWYKAQKPKKRVTLYLFLMFLAFLTYPIFMTYSFLGPNAKADLASFEILMNYFKLPVYTSLFVVGHIFVFHQIFRYDIRQDISKNGLFAMGAIFVFVCLASYCAIQYILFGSVSISYLIYAMDDFYFIFSFDLSTYLYIFLTLLLSFICTLTCSWIIVEKDKPDLIHPRLK